MIAQSALRQQFVNSSVQEARPWTFWYWMFGAVTPEGGGSNLLIGDLIEMQFLGNSYNLNVGSAMSLVLMIIVLLCMSFTSSFDEDEMEGVS